MSDHVPSDAPITPARAAAQGSTPHDGPHDGPQEAPGPVHHPAPADDGVTEIEVEVPEGHVVVVGPDGQPLGTVPASVVEQHRESSAEPQGEQGERGVTDLVEQPAKVMRIGSMVRHLLEEVKAAPLDEASRARLRDIHRSSIKELESGLSPELVEELERIALPFTEEGPPSEGELRIAQAQLVGWLEGLFHGIQTAIYAQQIASRAQLDQMRRALPGMVVAGDPRAAGQPGAQPNAPQASDEQPGDVGGMYL